MNFPPKKTELMSPAGRWPQLQTAIEAGADAVYFGLNHFSARAKVGFSLDELPEVMETLHARGVKGYVTFNTLVFEHELKQAESAILEMASSGVDAIIVQDIGIAQLARAISPSLEIHGSTQMSVTSAQGAELARSLGCSRVVLGRELSLSDIRKISETTDVELEVFVHGALCVSYSGQCFSSEAWGGRSANRGKCAQACRLSYDLVVDGQPRDLEEFRYLLSPGDLSAIDVVPDLVKLGIACLKIEGRYKESEYVGLTTQAYREAIDLAFMDLPNDISSEERLDLEQIYSRGLGPFFIGGVNHQKVVEGRAPRHRGVKIGKVIVVQGKRVVVEATVPAKRGDGVVFDAAQWRSPDEPEEGGNIYEVTIRSEQPLLLELEFGRDDIDFSRIRVGDLVWRTHDPQLTRKLKRLTRTEVPVCTRPISFDVTARIGMPLEILARLESGEFARFTGDQPLEAAQKRALDREVLIDKLGRLGGTPFHLKDICLLTEDPAFVPTSLLNQVRRQLVDELFETCGKIVPIDATPKLETELHRLSQKKSDWIAKEDEMESFPGIALHLLVRTPEQLEAAIASTRGMAGMTGVQVSTITLDYLELYGLRPSVEKIQEAGIRARVASPRILKPSEQNVIRFLLSLNADLLVRSGGLLYDLVNSEMSSQGKDDLKSEPALIGDFSLNAANSLAVWRYLDMGLSKLTPTYDLNAQQIVDLLEWVPSSALEVIAYSHLPVFHMEHCVFCRFLSDGTDNTNCGHPCEKHQVSVRDSQGREHPVMADVGCRNTIFGAEAQTDPVALQHWRDAGISDFRLEFVHQTAKQVSEITGAFASFFSGNATTDELADSLERGSPQHTTQGSLFVANDFKDLVQLT